MPVQKIEIGIVASYNKIKLPFDMGFNKIEKFFKCFNVFDCLEGVKVIENKDFSGKWLVFCQNVFMINQWRVLLYTIGKNCPNCPILIFSQHLNTWAYVKFDQQILHQMAQQLTNSSIHPLLHGLRARRCSISSHFHT